jgi:hypothetical protein
MLRVAAATALLATLAAVAPASAGSGASERFARFADGARATGKLTLILRWRDAQGGAGTVTSKLALDPQRRGDSRRGVAVLRGRGTATAVSASCTDRRSLSATGLGYTADGRDLMLQPGALPSGGAVDDPFATGCPGPTLRTLGEAVLPIIRLRDVPRGVKELRLKVTRRKPFADVAGYDGSVEARGRLRLRG